MVTGHDITADDLGLLKDEILDNLEDKTED